MDDKEKQNDEVDTKKRRVGERLRQERLNKGLSQSDLAMKIGTTVASINRWEHGKTTPYPLYKKKLSELFGKSVHELFEDEENVKGDRQKTSFPLPQERPPLRDQNRQRMLEVVYATWIKGLLEQSLQGKVLITLGLHEKSDAVTSSWKLILQELRQSERSLPEGASIFQAYIDAGKHLLILGEPGSGKTTLLLKLAESLLDSAWQDEEQPMPVIFNLSSWTPEQRPFDKWLIKELKTKYQVPLKLGSLWVEHDQILPLLDGLDEVASQHRLACIDTINSYRQEHGLPPLVLCSRTTEYQDLQAHLYLQNAVVIQPLTMQQIDEYLTRTGNQFESVRLALHDDPVMQELVSTPLMLNILMSAYQDKTANDLKAILSPEAQRKQIFATYVQRMFQRRRDMHYSAEQTTYWLQWLAQQMETQNQSEFYIEHLQTDWLTDSPLRRLYPAIAVGLFYGLFFGLIKGFSYVFMKGTDQYGRSFTTGRGILDGLLIGLFTASIFVFFNGFIFNILLKRPFKQTLSENERLRKENQRKYLTQLIESRPVYGLLNGLLIGSFIGLLIDLPAGIYNGLFTGLIYAGLGKLDQKIQPAEVLNWSWTTLQHNILRYVETGMLTGLAYGLLTGLYWQFTIRSHISSLSRFLPCLLFGLSIGVIIGLLVGVTRSFSATKLVKRSRPNQGIWNSARNSVLFAIVSWLLTGLFFGIIYGIVLHQIFQIFDVPYAEYINYFPKNSGLVIGLAYGLIVGAFFWLLQGGTACILHFQLRFLLWRARYAPWNYPQFLDEAAERILLRKLGGGYIFIHRLLQEYFSSLNKNEKK